jgi:polar amino acid transport system ATP-binding protein
MTESSAPVSQAGDALRLPVAVELAGIVKDYRGHRALDDVSLAVRPQEIVSIIGPSGAGKSTLLRCINLLETPTRGRVCVGDVVIDIEPTRQGRHNLNAKKIMRLRRQVGMVFQSYNVFPHLTALKNVSLPQRRVLGRSREEADTVSKELLGRVGLSDKLDVYPSKLSGGQQQRVAIARALALQPRVMLFDEPTSALDPEIGMEVLNVMRDLAGSGMTMIMVTHEIHFVRGISDRVVVMADGRVVEQGPAGQVFSDPTSPVTRGFLRIVLDR